MPRQTQAQIGVYFELTRLTGLHWRDISQDARFPVCAGAINAGLAASPGRGHRNAATAAKCAERQYPLLNNKLSEFHAGRASMPTMRVEGFAKIVTINDLLLRFTDTPPSVGVALTDSWVMPTALIEMFASISLSLFRAPS